MPVHNGAAYLREAVDSILGQTLADLELVIVDDCSTDDTVPIVSSYADPRIKLIRAPERLRICRGLNLGLDNSSGRYIARMDADDISMPQRLEQQVRFLERNPGTGICGSAVLRFGEGLSSRPDKRPRGSADVMAAALFDNPMVHSSVMFRREIVETNSLRYDDAFRNAEDYELWTRMFKYCKADNLDEVLLRYRVHKQSVTQVAGGGMDEAGCRVTARLLADLGLEPGSDEIVFHRYLGTGRMYPDRNRLSVCRAAGWLKKLLDVNHVRGVYTEGALRRAVSAVWYRACYHSLHEGFWMVNKYYSFKWGECICASPWLDCLFACAAVKSGLTRRGSAGQECV